MRALVIRPADALGRRVTERLLARGDEVRVLVSPIAEDRLLHPGPLDVVYTDAALDCAERAVADVDVVYDLGTPLAADGGAFDEIWPGSVDGSPALLEAATAAGVRRFVFVSSVAVYRPAPRRSQWPLAEDAPLEAHGSPELEQFGSAKIAAEERLAAAGHEGLEYVILRTSSMYGPGVTWAERLVAAAIRRRPLSGAGDGASTPMQWTHMEDLADAVALAGTHPAAARRTYNVAGRELFTRSDVERAVAVARDRWPWPAVLPDLSKGLKYDISRACAELGFLPRVRLADAIAELTRMFSRGWE
jgi:nucleoside-diphosphate-sugar epimerase